MAYSSFWVPGLISLPFHLPALGPRRGCLNSSYMCLCNRPTQIITGECQNGRGVGLWRHMELEGLKSIATNSSGLQRYIPNRISVTIHAIWDI